MNLEDKIVHSIIATKVNIHFNEELSRTPDWDKETKMYGNRYLNHIIGKEKIFERLEAMKEDQAIEVHDVFYDYLRAVTAVNIPEMRIVTYMVEAYLKNPKAMEKAVNKILK